MGVKTVISLAESNKLFASHKFTKLLPTSSGIIDTTYITDNHVLKRYEREVEVQRDTELLYALQKKGLNVSTCIANNDEWYLYEKLKGVEPRVIKTYHIVALARFLSAFHTITYKKCYTKKMLDKDEINALLAFTKKRYFAYYKKLELLKKYNSKTDGLVHGDIFKDNTLFEGQKIAVFDFIDSACGSFAFDMAVALVGFDALKHGDFFINIFLNTYNRHAPKKVTKQELLQEIDSARRFYALKRIYNHKNTKKAKELL